MTDLFQLLGLPRQPWLDPDQVHQAFLEKSKACHPDRVHGGSEAEKALAHDRYVGLNTAYNRLKELRGCVHHLVELESGIPPGDVQEIPHDTTQYFMKVGGVCREADAFIKAHEAHTSPILKAQRLVAAQPILASLQSTLNELASWHESLVSQLKELNGEWTAGGGDRTSALKSLAKLYPILSYQDRWSRQVREKMFLITSG